MKENINGSVHLHFWLNAVQHIKINYKLKYKNKMQTNGIISQVKLTIIPKF